MNKNPLVSIGIPTYNRAHFISETLDSLLNQSYKNIEIIIGDNASTDNTSEVVAKYTKKYNNIIYLKHKTNLGYSLNSNAIIDASHGKYVTIYHSDDIYLPTIIEEEVNVLENNSDLAGVFAWVQPIDEKGGRIRANITNFEKNNSEVVIVDLERYIKEMLVNYQFILFCPTSMIKKSVYKELNGYDPNMKYIEDQDMWIRILEKYNFAVINKRLMYYRIHSGQVSMDALKCTDISNHLKYLEKYLYKNFNLKNKYLKYIDINKAREVNAMIEDFIISKNKIDYEKINELILRSKSYYRFPLGQKEWFIQQANNLLGQTFISLKRLKNQIMDKIYH